MSENENQNPESEKKNEETNPVDSSSNNVKSTGPSPASKPSEPNATGPAPERKPNPVDSSSKDVQSSGPKQPDAEGKRAAATVAPAGKGPVEEPMTRRSFIKVLTLGWIAFAAALGGVGTMVMRFMFPNVLFEPKQSFKAGQPDQYSVGEVSLKWKSKFGVWIVRDEEKMYALSTVCTHLGCTPNWLANEAKFKCPCHGSGFYVTGINFEGPAPRPLERFKITLADDGQILIDKTKKFQQEKGEWSDPESYLLV